MGSSRAGNGGRPRDRTARIAAPRTNRAGAPARDRDRRARATQRRSGHGRLLRVTTRESGQRGQGLTLDGNQARRPRDRCMPLLHGPNGEWRPGTRSTRATRGCADGRRRTACSWPWTTTARRSPSASRPARSTRSRRRGLMRHWVRPAAAFRAGGGDRPARSRSRGVEAIGRLLAQPDRQELTRAEVRALGGRGRRLRSGASPPS